MKHYYLYGEVLGETPKEVADFLNQAKNAPVTFHINSGGGNIFSGIAIYNLLKQRGNVEVSIDGLCGSAATVIACAGNPVKMAENALFFVHSPSVGLADFYSADELEKIQNDLTAIKDTILTTYEARTKRPRGELEKLVDAETWLTADDALAGNFIDEITGAVDVQFDNFGKLIFMNRIEFSDANIDFEKIKAATHAAERVKPMEDIKQQIAAAVQAERKRITDLTALKCENAAVNKIIDLAVADGKTTSEIQPYVDAVKSVEVPKIATPPPVQNTAFEELKKIILDNMTSGAEGVQGSTPAPTAEETKKAQAEMLAQYTNNYLKGGVKK